MNFFLQIHRSIVDPSFYLQVINLPAKKVFAFLFKAVTLSVCLGALVHTYRLVDGKNGLPVVLPALLPDVVIDQGGIHTSRETPYTVNPASVSDALSVLFNVPDNYMTNISDSTIVVDTQKGRRLERNSSVGLLFAADSLYVRVGKEGVLTSPYSSFVSQGEVIVFDEKNISAYLKKRLVQLFLLTFFINLSVFVFIIAISIFFLTFAAFILRVGENYSLKTILKIVSFATSPVFIERILSFLAGAGVTWVWHVAFLISLIVIYRAKLFLSQKNDDKTSGVS